MAHKNPKKRKEYNSKYYIANKEKIILQNSIYAKKNAKKVKVYLKKYHIDNRIKVNNIKNIYHYKKIIIDINYNLSCHLRDRLRKAIKTNQKSGSAVKDLGCTIQEFKQYLELKFLSNMNWTNWGLKGWHIDHIKPLSKFDLSDRKEFLKACHYTNLQPLWAEDNFIKGNKV